MTSPYMVVDGLTWSDVTEPGAVHGMHVDNVIFVSIGTIVTYCHNIGSEEYTHLDM